MVSRRVALGLVVGAGCGVPSSSSQAKAPPLSAAPAQGAAGGFEAQAAMEDAASPTRASRTRLLQLRFISGPLKRQVQAKRHA